MKTLVSSMYLFEAVEVIYDAGIVLNREYRKPTKIIFLPKSLLQYYEEEFVNVNGNDLKDKCKELKAEIDKKLPYTNDQIDTVLFSTDGLDAISYDCNFEWKKLGFFEKFKYLKLMKIQNGGV